MVVGALAGIALAMAGIAWWAMRLTLRSGNEWGRVIAVFFVGIAAIGAFAGDLLLDGIAVAILVPSAACTLGFAAAAFSAARGDDGGGGGGGSDDEPPWWPSFERDLHRYERERVRS
jgi:hypothetical protein